MAGRAPQRSLPAAAAAALLLLPVSAGDGNGNGAGVREREGAEGAPHGRGEHSGAAPGAAGSVRGRARSVPRALQVRPALGQPGRAPLPASCCSGIRAGPDRCSIAGALRDTLCSEPLKPFPVEQPPSLCQHRDPAGVAAPWPSGVFAAICPLPPVSPGCVGVSVAPCAGAGRAGHGQGSPTHPARRSLRVCAERGFSCSISSIPREMLGSGGISLASVGLGFKSFPGAFWWLVCSERRFRCG